MSVARTGLPHTHRTRAAEDRSGDGDPTATAVAWPQLPAPDHATVAGNGSGPPRDVAAAAGISERRAYELLRTVRAEEPAP